MLYFVIFFPVLAALLVPAIKSDRIRGYWAVLSTGLTLLAMVLSVGGNFGSSYAIPLLRLTFRLDGFRSVYGTVVCFMWFVCAMLSPEYFRHHRHQTRYYFFFLLGLSSTVGVFLSADLYTTFLFFEMMSLGSYVWVVQEETSDAIAAGRTYLTIAILGGLVTLMGLFLLYHLTGTTVIAELRAACAAVENRRALSCAGLCVFFGFSAKAGAFPLHIWLPKAHPVAPAPASALLSGVLTKAGVFGILFVTSDVLTEDIAWGNALLIIGTITMVLGAVMAVFSNNLKYILACSSLSQIGFILLGVSVMCLLGEKNALAAHGTVLYMMNHSLVKLTLFLFAGVVYYNCHSLDLNDIRGFGRKKPFLQILFLCGALSLAGFPGFCGYLSKTLVHESIVEYAHVTGFAYITAVEWLFLFSGGLTTAYLTKIYVAVFWQKGEDMSRHWGTPLSCTALTLAAVTLPVIGLLPHSIADTLTDLTLDFTGGHAFAHAVHYFSLANLKGVSISLAIGIIVYMLFIRRVLTDQNGRYCYLWPAWLDLEKTVYLPVLRFVVAVISPIVRGICDLLDAIILLLRKTILRDAKLHIRTDPFRPGVHAMARFSDDDEETVSDRLHTLRELFSRMVGSISFALLMTCLGLCVVMLVILTHIF